MANYWIRAIPNSPTLKAWGYANGVNSAILRYDGAPNSDPTSVQSPSVIPLNEVNLHPLTDPAAVSNTIADLFS